jgi:hypothetical protein
MTSPDLRESRRGQVLKLDFPFPLSLNRGGARRRPWPRLRRDRRGGSACPLQAAQGALFFEEHVAIVGQGIDANQAFDRIAGFGGPLPVTLASEIPGKYLHHQADGGEGAGAFDGEPVRAAAERIAAVHPGTGATNRRRGSAVAGVGAGADRPLGAAATASSWEGAFEDQQASDSLSVDSPALGEIRGAAVVGRVATGPRAGHLVMRIGSDPTSPVITAGGPRYAHLEGFDLHANVAVRAGARARLENLGRYVLRPPVAQDALEPHARGQVFAALAPPMARRHAGNPL